MPAPLHPQESARLAALHRYAILDTLPGPEFDDLTRLAAFICGTPMATISLVDDHRQWFKSKVGLAVSETPREQAFCAHTILQHELLEVPNALADERFSANPLVLGQPEIRFYAGAPLTTSDGHNLGSLCVIDRVPRRLTPDQRDALSRLSRQVMAQLELRRSLQQLEAQSTFQKAILEGAKYSIISTDANGLILTFNAGAEKLLGYQAEEVVGRVTPALIHDPVEVAARAAELSRELGREIAPGFEVFVARARLHHHEEREWTYVRKDGTRFPVLLSVTVLPGENGGINGYLGIASDITERKRVAEELLRAKDAAESASKAKSDFLAVMSHEIRTPMNAIIGMTSLLLDTRLEPRQREFVTAVYNSGEALLEIINDILDFSKIESAQLKLEPEDFDLRLVTEGIFELLAPRAEAKRLEFAAIISPEVPFIVHGDDGRLRQVLVNLLTNSIKFTEAGHVVLRVVCLHRETDRLRLKFEVADTGIGIAPEKQNQLFHPFTQADSTTRRQYGGTGLGLAISKRLVELMGGEIGLLSTEGSGSTFWFTLDFGYQPHSAANRGEFDFSSIFVVVADSQTSSAESAEAMLTAWGVAAQRVAGGGEALLALEAARERGIPHVVVLADENLPDMQGTELARMIAQNPRTSGARIVMLTHRSLMNEPVSPLRGDAWLFKPVKQSQLFNYLVSLVHRSGQAAGVAAAAPATLPVFAGQHLRILVAEDHDINRRLTMLVLEKLGCRAEFARDGLQLVAAWKKSDYDVVLMDCQMPFMDGFEATREIRRLEIAAARPPARRTYIIALTANALKDERENCIDCGMDDYLSKPFRADGLREALQRAAVALGLATRA